MIGMLRLLSSGRDFWVEAEYHFNFFDKKDFQYARNKLIDDIKNRVDYLSRYQRETIELINHFSTKWQQTVVPDIATYYYDILGEIERHILDCQKAIEQIRVEDEERRIELICDKIGDGYACKLEDIVTCASLESKDKILTRLGYRLSIDERKELGLFIEGVNYDV